MNASIPISTETPQLRLYFLDLRLRYALIVLLLGLILVETSLGKALVLASLLWLGTALVLGVKRPSDQEVDTLLAADLKALVEKALRSLDSQEMMAAPLALFAPLEPGAQGHSPAVRRRVGRDGG